MREVKVGLMIFFVGNRSGKCPKSYPFINNPLPHSENIVVGMIGEANSTSLHNECSITYCSTKRYEYGTIGNSGQHFPAQQCCPFVMKYHSSERQFRMAKEKFVS